MRRERRFLAMVIIALGAGIVIGKIISGTIVIIIGIALVAAGVLLARRCF